jgi:hypothetical protein
MRKIDGLSLVFIDLCVPVLTRQLHWSKVTLQLSENMSFFVFCWIYTCHQKNWLDGHLGLRGYHLCKNYTGKETWAMGWMIGGTRHGRGWEFFSSPPCPHWLWDLPSLLSNVHQGLFPWAWSSWGMKLTTHFHLLPSSRVHGAIPPLLQYAFMA